MLKSRGGGCWFLRKFVVLLLLFVGLCVVGGDRLHGGGVLCHAGLDGLGPLWGTTYKTNTRRLSPTELTKQTNRLAEFSPCVTLQKLWLPFPNLHNVTWMLIFYVFWTFKIFWLIKKKLTIQSVLYIMDDIMIFWQKLSDFSFPQSLIWVNESTVLYS